MILTLFLTVHEGSPLGELHRCVRDRIKINVHIRTFKGLRGVCSGFLVAFDKFWNIALVDVDETFRKPILGKAFYNEPALTVTRLFEKLKIQQKLEDQEKSMKPSDSSPKNLEVFPSAHRAESASLNTLVQAAPTEVNPDSLNSSVLNKVSGSDLSKRRSEKVALTCTGAKQKRNRSSKPKVDYQKVSQRHVNQLFIRGENILLINLLE
uniref:Sm domain-containing protein n=1 Tax=Callorhinchus milii TaxID=7868 RepID=A0A4W3KJG7_CALMI